MSLKAINIKTGQYDISTGVSEAELHTLANDPKVSSIQFSRPLSNDEIDLLEKILFSQRPDISLRIYGHHSDECDLKFLERIPSIRKISADCLTNAKGIEIVSEIEHLEMLGVGIFDVVDFGFLDKVNPNLKELMLHQTNSKKPKISSINRFSNLEYLYLEGQQKGIESISELKNLQRIVLRSISTENLSYLKNLEKLWSVDIKLGGIKQFEELISLSNLKYLELWQIRDLSDLSFISKLKSLEYLFIQSLPKVSELPVLSDLKNLRKVYLENMKGLKALESLRHAPRLEEFNYIMAGNQTPEKMIPVLENSTVKRMWCGFGSNKKNLKFSDLLKEYNKEENITSFSDFKFSV